MPENSELYQLLNLDFENCFDQNFCKIMAFTFSRFAPEDVNSEIHLHHDNYLKTKQEELDLEKEDIIKSMNKGSTLKYFFMIPKQPIYITVEKTTSADIIMVSAIADTKYLSQKTVFLVLLKLTSLFNI